MSKSRWKESPCPQCGRPEKHDVGFNLRMCSICVMGANAVDWVKTFERVKAEAHYSQKNSAYHLDVSPQTITEIMAGRLKVSSELSAKIREKFREYLVPVTPNEKKERAICSRCGCQVYGQAKFNVKKKSFECLRCPDSFLPERAGQKAIKIQQKALVRQLA